MKNYKWGSIILFFIVFGFFIPVLISIPIIPEKKCISLIFLPPVFNQQNIDQWKETTIQADQNQNGLHDRLEQKLNLSSNFKVPNDKIFIKQQYTQMNETTENISLVIHFPKGDISTILQLFRNLGGKINVIYDVALNGFAGSINYQDLSEFFNILSEENVPFLIEEDCNFNTSLYYVSQNMNLRPYVWNSLSYTGDPSGAIALIDTGIDDSHTSFTPGYSEGNASFKIIGWRDILSNLSSPYDDNGHGSHCAGIAAGNGSSTLDGDGRMVATYAYVYDQRGFTFISNQTINIIAARFNVTNLGTVEINCAAISNLSGSGNIAVYAYLYHNTTIVDSFTGTSWNHTLTYNATNSTLGEYSLKIAVALKNPLNAGPYAQFRAEIYWPFNPPSLDSGNLWKGVAPATHLVAIKAMDEYGTGTLSNILDGINWVIANKRIYNITVLSLSFSGDAGQTSLISAVNNAVENGIVVVVAAGNDGGLNNTIGSPGDSDSVITVAAMNNADNITQYSSAGGLSYTGNTIKPDITAPGGSDYYFSIFSADSNDNDGGGAYSQDAFLNDLYPSVGTSMAGPAVAGAANLLIAAMGGASKWTYSAIEAKQVKALLLMSATETFPLTREVYANCSPTLERGGKDPHEGYGRLNPDAALEAYTQNLTLGSSKSAWLSSSYINSFSKHALGCYVDLLGGQNYSFKLVMPSDADFDLYLYNNTATSIGEPQLLTSSISNESGKTELIRYTPPTSGKFYLIAKAIQGEGLANISNVPNNFVPLLLSSSVSPPTGNQSTLYNFSVLYTDADDFAPIFVELVVNETPYRMEKLESANENYTDGAIFQYLTYLQPADYNYSFRCSDGKFNAYFFPPTLLTVNKTNTLSPYMTDSCVSPEIGENSTWFDFKVKYFDPDNNFPSNINVTINATTHEMVKVNLLDRNVMDGAEYHFTTVLEFGYYQFQFACADGLYSNVTAWINAPEVTPFFNFSEELIVINEVFTAHPSNIELYNYGIDKNMTGWTLQLYYNNVLLNTYEFPTGWIFQKQSVVVLHEKWGTITGIDNMTDLFANWTIPWDSGRIAVGLFNKKGYHQDWFQTTQFTGVRPADVKWTPNSLIELNSNCAYRIIDEDTNNASDWLVDNFGTPGYLNPGQTGERKNSLFAKLLYPLNNSVTFSGTIEYNWESLELPIGPVNYTLQISEFSNFSTILQEKTDIPEIFNTTSTNLTITLPSGQYYWRICSVYGIFKGFWSNYCILNVIYNEFSPNLINGSVNPPIGSQNTLFNFSIIYLDSDNNPPFLINLSINDNLFPLEKQDNSDINYSDGCIYQYLTFLKPGIYNISFECNDGKFGYETTPDFNLNVTEINIAPCILTNGYVSSNIGYENTVLFKFFVNYSDADNNAPDYVTITLNSTTYYMSQQNSLDINYTDGCIFIYSLFLKKGNYTFYFNCSDGIYFANQGPYNGPMVTISVPWNQVSLENVRIGAVITHGETNPRTKFSWYPYITQELIQRGVNITDITGLLTSNLLSNYDIIWFCQGGADMGISEIDAVEEWIEEGGRLLITGSVVEWGSTVNLIQRFNLSYCHGPSIGGNTTNINFHPITNYLDHLAVQSSYTALNISAQPYAEVCVKSNDYVVVAAMEFGKGRIAIICDDHILSDSAFLVNHIFTNNTFGWLGYKSKFAPSLQNPQTSPIASVIPYQFNFSILFRDLDNNAPLFINVIINSTVYTLQKQNPLDINYSDGCLYQSIITLTPGIYYYSFECSDIVFYNYTNSYSIKVNPIVASPPFPYWSLLLIGASLAVIILFGTNRKARSLFFINYKGIKSYMSRTIVSRNKVLASRINNFIYQMKLLFKHFKL